MQIRYFQKGFNYSQDGTGNRLVIHLQGCNLHCPWCSNPEGMALDGGKSICTEDLAQEIISCKRLFFDGGGVTFTGGECTMQKEALKEVLFILKQNDIHTAIETNGTCVYDEQLFSMIDLVICDFKHYDANKLINCVGGNANYINNIKDYIKHCKNVLIRTVLINDFNSTENDAIQFANFFCELDCTNVQFEFLPYHEYGKQKWKALNKEYATNNAFIKNGTLETFEKIYNEYKLNTIRS